ncbi:hypothetical protein [Bradyrhizobium sp.]|uniref:hypothetical protein n=1 Tax=Bradyrhizobium sp. TaxID=376 RepID=UPI002BA03FB7|nr:hypothetical protein [Bradyrhizobium sp.]HWX57675.1 hypothetical protein [Bradyrhizobium sp.]
MLRCTISGAAIALGLAMATPRPTAAQEVVAEPGNCAFFYPYANCQNKGPGNPDADPYFRRSLGARQPNWSGGTFATPERARIRHPEAIKRLE